MSKKRTARTTKSRSGAAMELKRMLVTPQMAKEWLEDNLSNRSLSATTWKHYLKIMHRGEWGECPQPIVRNGTALLDGQHRLRALQEYGEPLWFWVATAASDEIRKLVDRGRTRTVADVLRMEYGIQYAHSFAAVAKWIQLLDTGVNERLSPPEVVEIIARRRAAFDWLKKSHAKGGKYFRGAFFVGPMVWAFAKWPQEVDDFHHKVCTGENITRYTPAMRLRDRIVESATAGYGNGRVLALTTLMAFDNHLRGEEIKNLKAGAAGYMRLRREMRMSAKGGAWAEAALRTSRVRISNRRRGIQLGPA